MNIYLPEITLSESFGNYFACLARPGMNCQGYSTAPDEPGFSPINRALCHSPATLSPDERRW
ncbi:MAG: hypothetical protein HS114_35755 [Anaerolineales bacterium]|nr:hypothetical protein [Anaerolineales bacterium]